MLHNNTQNIVRKLTASIGLAVLLTTAVFAQTTLPPVVATDLNLAQCIQEAVQAQSDLGSVAFGTISAIPITMGNNGAAIYRGVSADGNEILGDGVQGSVNISWNTTITGNLAVFGSVGTTIGGTTVVSWTSIAGADGAVHTKITITVGTSTKAFTRVIEIARPCPVEALKPKVVPATTPVTVTDSSGSDHGWEGTSWVNDFLVAWENSNWSWQDVPTGQVTYGDPYVVGEV